MSLTVRALLLAPLLSAFLFKPAILFFLAAFSLSFFALLALFFVLA